MYYTEEDGKKYWWDIGIGPKLFQVSSDYHGFSLFLHPPTDIPFVYTIEESRHLGALYHEKLHVRTPGMDIYVGTYDYTWRDREDLREKVNYDITEDSNYTEKDNLGYIMVEYEPKVCISVDVPFSIAKVIHELLIKNCITLT